MVCRLQVCTLRSFPHDERAVFLGLGFQKETQRDPSPRGPAKQSGGVRLVKLNLDGKAPTFVDPIDIPEAPTCLTFLSCAKVAVGDKREVGVYDEAEKVSWLECGYEVCWLFHTKPPGGSNIEFPFLHPSVSSG